MTNSNTGPLMSVVFVTPATYRIIRKTIAHLRTQSQAERLEIVIAAPDEAKLKLVESELAVFHSYQIVEYGDVKSTSRARALGIMKARAPIVALAEDHSYPAPGWVEVHIEAHQGPWAAVGPVITNPNPQLEISWVQAYMEYAPWLHPAEAGEQDYIPGHNSSYKTKLLQGYNEEQLKQLLDAEMVLHEELRAQGHRLYLEPRAQTAHLNFERALGFVQIAFYGGRYFAASRARKWNLKRRLAYIVGAPLIPFLRFWRIRSEWLRPGRREPQSLSFYFYLALALLTDGFAQLLGYALGEGKSMEQVFPFEHERTKYLLPRRKGEKPDGQASA